MSFFRTPVDKKLPAKTFLTLPVVGTLVFVIMTFVLADISEDIINNEPLTVADVDLSNWLHSHATPWLTRTMFVCTAMGSTVVVTCIAVAIGLYLLQRKRLFWLSILGLSVGGGALLNKFLKYVFHRPRPHFDDPILKLSSYSFPSGHTMMATVLYGVIAAYLVSRTANWGWRVLIVFCAGLLIGCVAFSRIYLGAHYLSDVLGAMAEGLAWLSFCLTVLYSIRERRRRFSKVH